MLTARQVVEADRAAANHYAATVGRDRVRALLEETSTELEGRLAAIVPNAEGGYGAFQIRSALAQVRAVLADLNAGLRDTTLELGEVAARSASQTVIDMLQAGEAEFGAGTPLNIDQARLIDSAVQGASRTVLRRLVGDGSPARPGILQRYGESTLNEFEGVLKRAAIQKMPWDEVRTAITEKSPFLQGKPAYWAERIVRTETMNMHNAAAFEGTKTAHKELGDVVKILAATFDDRTAADSYAVHGQIRRVNEMFDTWQGPVMFPPARPNDREIVVTHRIGWRIPPYLKPMPLVKVLARWKYDGRKGKPPPIPPYSTIPIRSFGR